MSPAIPIERDPASVDGREFDVVIAGAGINGVLCAVEAAHRGHSTLLVDRDDFGAGASFQSLRTLHGGLRYLQTLDLARAASSGRQRDWWVEYFADLVVVRPCLMPLYARSLRSPTAFRIAGGLAHLVGIKSPALPPGNRAPVLRFVNRDQVRDCFPGIPDRRLKGGAIWHEALIPDSPRIVVECIRWAVGAGARALNYVAVNAARPAGTGWSRVTLIDRHSNATIEVAARAIVNATGANVDAVARRLGGRSASLLSPTVAWNLLLDASLDGENCLALTPARRGAQTYFVQPFHGRLLAGTGHAPAPAGETTSMPTEESIERMRADLESAYPEARLGQAPVLRILAGMLPGRRAGDARLALRPRIVRDPAREGAALVHVIGVKLTEAPEVARRALDLAGMGTRTRRLAPRPQAMDGWNVLDPARPATREPLLDLAARESVLYLEDLIERRTNAWVDEAARRRVADLIADSLAASMPGAKRERIEISNGMQQR